MQKSLEIVIRYLKILTETVDMIAVENTNNIVYKRK